MKNHWKKLTLFLHVPGAPLDNTICERALKKVILHHKNALFFKTTNGAHVADMFISLIHTCELSGVDPLLLAPPGESRGEALRRIFGLQPDLCPVCKLGRLIVRAQWRATRLPLEAILDTLAPRAP